jgi:hypothetical protein
LIEEYSKEIQRTQQLELRIDANANNVVVTWWETNETSDVPVMKVSTDNGETFGPLLRLGANGTIGSGE